MNQSASFALPTMLRDHSQGPSIVSPAQSASVLQIDTWDEIEWDRLLLLVEEGTVIPVIGAELSLRSIGSDGQPVLLTLGRDLAKRLKVSAEALPPDSPLNEIACRLAARDGSAQDLYLELYQLLRKSPIAPSEPLRQLAQITDFKLLITTGFDTALEAAIAQAWSQEALSLSYSPNDVQDVPGQSKTFRQPVVYHLLGKVSAKPNFVVTDEDMLEFFHALLSPQRRPEKLFDELADSNLLLVGGGYADWLARLFLRTAKGKHRLSDARSVREYIAAAKASLDANFVLFIQHFSKPTRLYADADPVAFVAELHRRWCERNPGKLLSNTSERREEAIVRPLDEMPDDAVFISYARADVAAVRNLYNGLTTRGIKAWFDFDRLEAGDEYESKINRNIKCCAVFLPIISRHTEDPRARFFKREWNFAVDHSHNYLPDDPFIIPVAVDDSSAGTAHVPDRFLTKHWTHLPDGEVTEEFAAQLRRILIKKGGTTSA
jgi:hypothetical protein